MKPIGEFMKKISPGLIAFWAAAIAIVAISLWFIISVFSTGFIGDVGREEIARVVSPNGSVDAVMIQTNGGATTSFGHQIYVVNHGQKVLPPNKKNDKAMVAFVDRTTPKLQWESPTQLVVVHINDKYSDLRQSQITVAGQNIQVALRGGPTDPPSPKPEPTAETTSTASRLEQFYKGPKPIAVVVEYYPWNEVRGSDMPRVVVYDDGQVVYWKTGNDPCLYFTKKLDPAAFAEVKKRIEGFGDYSKLASDYDLTADMKDHPRTSFYVSVGKPCAVSLYGRRIKSEMPRSLYDLECYLCTLEFSDAKPWKPPYAEVMLWEYDNAPAQVYWPKQWPGIDSPVSFRHGNMISIFLPGKDALNLKVFLRSLGERCAVVIGGKKYAIRYRYAFPGEPMWKKAFAEPAGK